MSPHAPAGVRARPLVSFVLVVHREQAYLEECTASLLADAGVGVELIAIDDASPDQAPRLLDELADRDGRVRVHHVAGRIGLGEARNLALDIASGDYAWFVETTDLLSPAALPDIAARLRTEAPDLLLVHHERREPLGGRRAGPHRKRLARAAERGPGPLDRHPGLAEAAPRAWDKLLRLEHLRRLGVRFGAGGHAELSVTWPALLAAERIAATPTASYLRRRPPNAVRDRFVEGTPFDVFDRYDAVFAFIARHGEIPDERRRLVLPAAVRDQLSLLGLVAPDERQAYFRRASEGFARHRRGDEPDPGTRLEHLRSTLLAHDSHVGFQLLEEALDARRALQRRRTAAVRLRGRVTERVRHEERKRHYRVRRGQPIDSELAVYAAYWNRGYSCNPRAVYEKARELVPEIRGVWVVEPDAVALLPPGVDHVIAGTHEYYDLIARAGYFVNNVNFPNDFVKREGTVHVMTHHGTPLKHMGLDLQQSRVAGSRMNYTALLERCRRWDYSISSNPFSTLIWERVYPVPYESLEVGYPRNDVLVDADADAVRRIRAELDIRPDQQAVLYAPTHREYRAGYVPVLDIAAVADALGPDYVLLARLHYFYGADPVLRALHRDGRVRDVAAHPSIEELCLAADVLVTDYSSLMFDYAVLDRPIVIHAPDWEVYRATRGTYFDLMAEPPGSITRTEAELIGAFRSGTVAGADADQARAAFRARFCALEDGHAAERVVRRVWLGEPAAVAPPAVSLA